MFERNSNANNRNSNLKQTDFASHNERSSIRKPQHLPESDLYTQTNKCPHEETDFASHN
jgi:hypothetical protein